ncbi:MAG: hypothetical protein E7481_02685 [Ruminococcaceae bacterium]|nr:hypothetical protein [Oscillospiraceae bacterium]
MNDKIKNIVVTSVFVTFIAFFVVMCAVSFFNPVETSEAERRPLAQFPDKITWEGIIDKTVINDFEDYSVDQFPFREFFRNIKANFQLNVLQLKENNGLAIENGYIVKIEQDFVDKNVDYSIGKLQAYYEQFVKDNGGKHYISLIPDKNYFLGKDYGYPAPDYESLTNKVTEALPNMKYIDIFGELKLEDYYLTDTHWSQDKILGVADKLAGAMGVADKLSGEYKENVLEGFKGVYYGQSALKPATENLVYLTNDILDSCTVFDYERNTTGKIYDLEKFNGTDGYDVFLSGTKPLLRIDNPNSDSDKKLVIFRDSYGSSITPLLAEAYDTIYIVDIRYIDAGMLGFYDKMNMVDFEGADVLFLYSALILNSNSFK